MYCSTTSNLSQASVMLGATFALFASVCIGVPAAGSSASLPQPSCAPTRDYMVKPGDNCSSISQNQLVSTVEIMALNCLKADGTDLQTNTKIHLPGCCTIYNVQSGDNCKSVAKRHNLTVQNFYNFNPAIHQNCSNLLSGNNVCVTKPSTPYNPLPCPAKPTTTSATSAATSQPSLAPGTASDCQPVQVAVTDDNCLKLAPKGDVQHFLKINPSVNSDCSNIVVGQGYCVSPP